MRARRRFPGTAPLAACAVAAWCLAGCETPTIPDAAEPYDFRLTVDRPDGSATDRTFHWALGSTVAVYLPEAERPGRPSLRVALQRAVATWNAAAVFGEVRLAETGELGDADAVLGWSDGTGVLSTPATCVGPVAGAASTRGCLTDDDNALRRWPRRDGGPSRVLFRVVVEPTGDPGLLDRLVIHEMGHVLGILAHSNDLEDVMSGGPLTSTELTARDLVTLRSLYQTAVDLPAAALDPGG